MFMLLVMTDNDEMKNSFIKLICCWYFNDLSLLKVSIINLYFVSSFFFFGFGSSPAGVT